MGTASGLGLQDLLGIDLPIIQAPMAGATTPDMVIAVSEAGGLGSLPSAQYTEVDLRAALDRVRAGTRRPINLNFFCHATPADDAGRQPVWLARLAGYYAEAGLDPNSRDAMLRVFLLLGQVLFLRIAEAAVTRRLKIDKYDEAFLSEVKGILRQNVRAMVIAAREGAT